MRKYLPALILISFLFALAVPAFVGAVDKPPECCKLKRQIEIEGTTCNAESIVGPSGGTCTIGSISCTSSYWGMFCLLNTLYNITDWIFVILVGLAAILVIMGALTIMMAGGSPEKLTTGRNYIMFAAIGLLVGFLAKAVPGIVKMISGF